MAKKRYVLVMKSGKQIPVTGMTGRYYVTREAQYRKNNQEIRELRMHIITYSKTRDTYTAYRKAGYSGKFFEAHREEIALHKAAKDAFDQPGLKKIPRVAELNEEFNRLAREKNAEYAQYRAERERMRNLANARRNVEMLLKEQGENVESKDRKQIKS